METPGAVPQVPSAGESGMSMQEMSQSAMEQEEGMSMGMDDMSMN